MKDQIKRGVIYNKVVNGRRFVVTRNGFDVSPEERKLYKKLAHDWYCGYMQILPSDKEYALFKDDEDDLNGVYESDHVVGHIYGIGGITFMGKFNIWPYDGYYLGFDTAHYFSRDVTEEEVIRATLDMEKGLEK